MSEEETKSAKIPMFMTALGGKGYSYLTIPGADPIPVDTEDFVCEHVCSCFRVPLTLIHSLFSPN